MTIVCVHFMGVMCGLVVGVAQACAMCCVWYVLCVCRLSRMFRERCQCVWVLSVSSVPCIVFVCVMHVLCMLRVR